MVLGRDISNLTNDKQKCTLQSTVDHNEEHSLIKLELKMHSIKEKKKSLFLGKLECSFTKSKDSAYQLGIAFCFLTHYYF